MEAGPPRIAVYNLKSEDYSLLYTFVSDLIIFRVMKLTRTVVKVRGVCSRATALVRLFRRRQNLGCAGKLEHLPTGSDSANNYIHQLQVPGAAEAILQVWDFHDCRCVQSVPIAAGANKVTINPLDATQVRSIPPSNE